VGIKEVVKDMLIPSEEHKMKIFPLDFEEFLDALHEQPIKEHIRVCFNARQPLAHDIHDKAMGLFRLYMAVGGMPQSVAAYVGNPGERLEACDAAKREILSLYEDDIGKYAKGYAVKVRDIFRAIPGALAKHEKKFHLSEIDSNARKRRYETAFLWLSDAMVANIAYNATTPDSGLSMSLDHESFKCYLLDTGLLLTQSLSGERTTDARLVRGILHDNLGINEGMFTENAVAQSLVASGHPLYFFSRRDRSRSDGTLEIDFILKKGIKTCPIEVKSATYKSHISLDRFSARYRKYLGARYVLCRSGFTCEDGVTYLPLYMAHLI
jgi:predicted AAA+ superfamily ATPase